MKRFLLGTVSALALTHGAAAADMPVKAPPPVVVPTWAGFYIGAQGGFASHYGSFYDMNGFFYGGGPNKPTFSASRTGGIVGVNAGFNLQSGNVVYGLEGDLNAIGAKATATDFNPNRCVPVSACPFNGAYDARWLATARARLGWAWDATLFYVTGGAAFGRVSNSWQFLIVNTPFGTFSQDTTKVGWVFGAGVERMLNRNWTVRAEVRYVDLGRTTVTCGAPGGCAAGGGNTYRGEFRNSLLIGLVGVDFKF
jgi:outer membrane immunogenic protein